MYRDFEESIGFKNGKNLDHRDNDRLFEYVNLKLAALGKPMFGSVDQYPLIDMSSALLASYQEKNRLLANYLCPPDRRIQEFLSSYLDDVPEVQGKLLLPSESLVVDRHGQARILSLPPNADCFSSNILESYRVKQGVLHNPRADRRTTKGVFHVCEGGLPIPGDKKAVPKITFARLLLAALQPPTELLRLPFTAEQDKPAELFVSLLLRPVVTPAVPGYCTEKSMEIRFFAPGNLVSNLDFVESIFGNAGDPYLLKNDAAIDTDHWAGYTGCVFLAPHLTALRKKDLGLPAYDDATERQRRDGMCWKEENEFYNDGGAFKITCRDARGVIVTLIADNYYGYCKKEVKTQISYATNLYGQCEEEHAGGALAFASFDLGEDFHLSEYFKEVDHTFVEQMDRFGEIIHRHPDGYATDRAYPNILYVPEDARFDVNTQRIEWSYDGSTRTLKLLPDRTYVLPSGYRVNLVNPRNGQRWRLLGTAAEGIFCHKPCTVSGGGKSEISKSIEDAMLSGPNLVGNFKEDFNQVEAIVNRDFSDRYRNPHVPGQPSRPLLSKDRSLGSVVRLLTPSPDFTAEYNAWLESIPRRIRDLVLTVKRFYKPNWGYDWRSRFSVDTINGMPGHELKYKKSPVISRYLRVGYDEDGSWRIFSLRKDYWASAKVQMEDDISVSITVPRSELKHLNPELVQFSHKFIHNCEYRLFQRPDDAIVRGYDKKAELDFSRRERFFSNYEPLTREAARDMIDDSIAFDKFTKPMQKTFRAFVRAESPDYVVTTACPRLVDGEPTKNPRYLQNRPDLEDPCSMYLAKMGLRMFRRIPLGIEVPLPATAVLPGRRNNPPNPVAGIRPLAVYNPIHYQELPELFMEFIASLTGRSPSTTGAGSEGALTKGPFNALPPIIDLNNALVSFILTGHPAFSTAAGYVGHKYRVDHDISLLVPEIWSRMHVHEQDPQWLLKQGYLERCEDFEHNGQTVLASRLGYRITARFVNFLFGRVFSNPDTVLTDEMLKPELQSLAYFVDGINNIVETQKKIAQLYFDDGSVEMASPPLKALLHIMVHGTYEGATVEDASVRSLFTREALLDSEWYRRRLETRVQVKKAFYLKLEENLEQFRKNPATAGYTTDLDIDGKLERVREELRDLDSPAYIDTLVGTLGTDPGLYA